VGVAHNKHDIIHCIEKTKPDLVLLDIRMEHAYDGIEIAQHILNNWPIPFVYVTAHSDKDIIEKALPTKPSGYIIKPFKPMDVYTAIHIASDKFRNHHSENYLMLNDGYKTQKVFNYKIIFLKSDNNYVEIHTDTKTFIERTTLDELAEKLNDQDFIKVHRSYLVNKNHIKGLHQNTVEVGAFKIPVSRRNLTLVKQYLTK
jgi:DNA-binding LytR/AlgR family response regulator